MIRRRPLQRLLKRLKQDRAMSLKRGQGAKAAVTKKKMALLNELMRP
jgi:hypothetical protein